MKRFGVNPHGEAMYRIVYAPTRRYLVAGTWPDGSTKASWAQLYGQLGDVWVMERWESGEDFAKCSREKWDCEYSVLGPWPDKGEYRLCHDFAGVVPSELSIEKLVGMIEMGLRTPFGATRAHQQAEMEAETRATDSQKDAMIRNWLPAFGTNPMVGHGGGRGSKTAKELKSAQELGLPGPGARRTRTPKNAPTFEIPVQI